MDLYTFFVYPFYPFLFFPPFSFVPAGIFLFKFYKKRNILIGLAAFSWFLYGAYECYMWFWMQTVIAPIREGLFVVIPFLYIMTAMGIWASRGRN